MACQGFQQGVFSENLLYTGKPDSLQPRHSSGISGVIRTEGELGSSWCLQDCSSHTQKLRMNLVFLLAPCWHDQPERKTFKSSRFHYLFFPLGFILFTPSWESLLLHTTFLKDAVHWKCSRAPSVISELTGRIFEYSRAEQTEVWDER